MKEHPVLVTLILVVVIWASATLLENFTATQGEIPGLSLYAFYSLCTQEGTGESCRRELVDAHHFGLLPMVVRSVQTPTPSLTPQPSTAPVIPASTGTPTTTPTPDR